MEESKEKQLKIMLHGKILGSTTRNNILKKFNKNSKSKQSLKIQLDGNLPKEAKSIISKGREVKLIIS